MTGSGGEGRACCWRRLVKTLSLAISSLKAAVSGSCDFLSWLLGVPLVVGGEEVEGFALDFLAGT